MAAEVAWLRRMAEEETKAGGFPAETGVVLRAIRSRTPAPDAHPAPAEINWAQAMAAIEDAEDGFPAVTGLVAARLGPPRVRDVSLPSAEEAQWAEWAAKLEESEAEESEPDVAGPAQAANAQEGETEWPVSGRQAVEELLERVSRALGTEEPLVVGRGDAVRELDRATDRCREAGDKSRGAGDRARGNELYALGAECQEVISERVHSEWTLMSQSKWLVLQDRMGRLSEVPTERPASWADKILQPDCVLTTPNDRLNAIAVLHRAARVVKARCPDKDVTLWLKRALGIAKELLLEQSPKRIVIREVARAVRCAAALGLERGEWEGVANDVERRPTETYLRHAVAVDLAHAWLSAGNPERAEQLARVVGEARAGDASPVEFVWAEALQALGRPHEAADVLTQAAKKARELSLPAGIGDWLEWRAVVILDEAGLVSEAILGYLDLLAESQPRNTKVAQRVEELLRAEFGKEDAKAILKPFADTLGVATPAQALLLETFGISPRRTHAEAELEAQALYERAKRADRVSSNFTRALELHRKLAGSATANPITRTRLRFLRLRRNLAGSATADPITRTRLGFLEARVGNTEQARRIAEELSDADSFRFSLLGLVHATEGRLEDAIRDYEKAWRLSGDRAPLDQLAWLLLQRGDPELSSRAFERLVRDHPEDAIGWMHLGMARLAAGEVIEAAHALLRSFLLEAHAAGPDDIGATDPGIPPWRRTARLLGSLAACDAQAASLVLAAARKQPFVAGELVYGLAVGRSFSQETLDQLLQLASDQPLGLRLRVAQYAMTAAVEIAASIQPEPVERWLEQTVEQLNDLRATAELLAGAKGSYARTVRRLVGRRARGEYVQLRDSGQCPAAFRDLFGYIAGTRNARDYYIEVQRRLALLQPSARQIIEYAVFQVHELLRGTWYEVESLPEWEALAKLPASPSYVAPARLGTNLNLVPPPGNLPWLWTDQPAAEVAVKTVAAHDYHVSRLTCRSTADGMIVRLADGLRPAGDRVWPQEAITVFDRLGWVPLSSTQEGWGFRVPAAAAFEPLA
jgi:tetratricopeptide (TPR) repeat protein